MRQYRTQPVRRLRAPLVVAALLVLVLALIAPAGALMLGAIAQYKVSVRNSQLDAKTTAWGTTATLKVFTGDQPANCAAANTGTELVSMALPNPPLAAAAAGAQSKSGTWSGTGIAAGTAGHYRVYNSNATFDGTTCVEQGDVTDQMTLDTTTISIGLTVTVTAYTCTRGNA